MAVDLVERDQINGATLGVGTIVAALRKTTTAPARDTPQGDTAALALLDGEAEALTRQVAAMALR